MSTERTVASAKLKMETAYKNWMDHIPRPMQQFEDKHIIFNEELEKETTDESNMIEEFRKLSGVTTTFSTKKKFEEEYMISRYNMKASEYKYLLGCLPTKTHSGNRHLWESDSKDHEGKSAFIFKHTGPKLWDVIIHGSHYHGDEKTATSDIIEIDVPHYPDPTTFKVSQSDIVDSHGKTRIGKWSPTARMLKKEKYIVGSRYTFTHTVGKTWLVKGKYGDPKVITMVGQGFDYIDLFNEEEKMLYTLKEDKAYFRQSFTMKDVHDNDLHGKKENYIIPGHWQG